VRRLLVAANDGQQIVIDLAGRRGSVRSRDIRRGPCARGLHRWH